MNKNAIIIGASSGIGRSLAGILSREGYRVGITGRRLELLEELRDSLPGDILVEQMDVSHGDETRETLARLIEAMGRVDLVIISAGTGHLNPELDLALEMDTVATNVDGLVVVANVIFKHFESVGGGHLVGISSIAAMRGSAEAPAYSASKAFMSSYLDGLRYRACKTGKGIKVTDIRPGFVDTRMAKGEGLFWVASPDKAARQIYSAIRKGRKRAYVTKRWALIAFLMRLLP